MNQNNFLFSQIKIHQNLVLIEILKGTENQLVREKIYNLYFMTLHRVHALKIYNSTMLTSSAVN